MKWKSLQMPKRVEVGEESLTGTFGEFVAEPLERGFGTTLGNSLRRVLLSSLQGAAVTAIRIDGVLHEFTTVKTGTDGKSSDVPGVQEDVTEIILNIKELRLKLHANHPKSIRLEKMEPGPVHASDIQGDADVEILNPDLYIATVSRGGSFKMEMVVGSGRGFVPAESHEGEDRPIGLIPIDSLFSPVRHVEYRVENTRVGQRTDYDKLVMRITTDGSMNPQDAVSMAAKILKDHLQLFITFEEEPEVEVEEEVSEEVERVRDLLMRSVNELELSVRAANCLEAAGIKTIADLVQKSEQEMLKYRNFGRKSLKEISDILRSMNLHFGMDVAKYVAREEREGEAMVGWSSESEGSGA
jgi:DNA-directed RNA polymerase subunit alpha